MADLLLDIPVSHGGPVTCYSIYLYRMADLLLDIQYLYRIADLLLDIPVSHGGPGDVLQFTFKTLKYDGSYSSKPLIVVRFM